MMNKKNKAYTLAEVMIVLLVITIIFALAAPIFTKRKLSSINSISNIWNFNDKSNYDAYYYAGSPKYLGESFLGVNPGNGSAVTTTYAPASKLIIRSSLGVTSSNILQRQIQFRYGQGTKGNFAGTWFVDQNNMLMGGTYKNIVSKIGSTNDAHAKGNTSIGSQALDSITTGQNNTAIGTQALQKLTTGYSNTAIGYSAGYSIASSSSYGNTMVGSKAGLLHNGSKNTFVGYYTGYGSGTAPTGANENIFIGAFAGYSGSQNVAIGYKALNKLENGSKNVAIGSGALSNLTSGSYNVAIGYNACNKITSGSGKTCIGYNSGPGNNSFPNDLTLATTNSDTHVRTYIGSKPKGFGGDAVLEIHNIDSPNNGLDYDVHGNETTVINGNLIVNGRPFFTVDGGLMHFHDQIYPMGSTFTETNGSVKYRIYGYYSGSSYSTAANNQPYYPTGYGAACVDEAYTYKDFAEGCPDINTGTKVYTSDRRLKNISSKNIDGLEKIKQLKVFNYNFKDDKDKKLEIGVMAQDLQKIFPNSVFKDEKGFLKIRWDEMFFASINAIKELDKKITAIIKKTKKVETQITKLEKENAILKTQIDELTIRINKLKNTN